MRQQKRKQRLDVTQDRNTTEYTRGKTQQNKVGRIKLIQDEDK